MACVMLGSRKDQVGVGAVSVTSLQPLSRLRLKVDVINVHYGSLSQCNGCIKTH